MGMAFLRKNCRWPGRVLTAVGLQSRGFMQKQQGHSHQAIPGFGHSSYSKHLDKPVRKGRG